MQATTGLLGIFVQALLVLCWFIQTVVFVWVILSWLLYFAAQTSFRWRNPRAYRMLVQLNALLDRATNPMLRPFRRLLPSYKTGGFDWSPFLLYFALWILTKLIVWAYGLILIR